MQFENTDLGQKDLWTNMPIEGLSCKEGPFTGDNRGSREGLVHAP